jgi:hypothetical protein
MIVTAVAGLLARLPCRTHQLTLFLYLALISRFDQLFPCDH